MKDEIWFFIFEFVFLFLCLCELFGDSKYMIAYKIENLWDLDSFPDWKTFKIWYFSKLNNFRNLMIFEIVKFGKLFEFSKLEIFGIILQIRHFWDFANCKFFYFSKIQILRIV